MTDASPPHLHGLTRHLTGPGPGAATRCLALALGAVATSRFEAAEEAFEEALRHGAPVRTCLEIAASAHLLAGFPRAINGLEALHRALSRSAAAGLDRPERPLDEGSSEALEPLPPREILRARGRGLFERIYGPSTDDVLRQLAALAPDYDDWILEHAYGRVLSRDGATPLVRELAVAGALVMLDVPRQLRSHVRGALRLGATPTDLAGLVATMEILAREDQMSRAREILELEGIDPRV